MHFLLDKSVPKPARQVVLPRAPALLTAVALLLLMPVRVRQSTILAMRSFKETVDAFSQRQLAIQSGRLVAILLYRVYPSWGALAESLKEESRQHEGLKAGAHASSFILPWKCKNLSHKRLRKVMEMATMMTATLIRRTMMVGPKQEATRA